MKKMTIATVALVAALSAFPRDVGIVVDVAAKPIASVDYSAAGAKLGAGPAMAKQDDFHALVARTKRAFAAFDRGKTDVSPFNGKTDRIWTRYLSLALRDHRKALAHGKDGDFEYLSLEGRGQNCIVAVNPGAEPVKLTVTRHAQGQAVGRLGAAPGVGRRQDRRGHGARLGRVLQARLAGHARHRAAVALDHHLPGALKAISSTQPRRRT